MSRVVVVHTSTANTASVLTALRRAGADPVLADDPGPIASAERLVLPGVGAFGAARSALDAHGLTDAVLEHLRSERPFLGICLGLQLLARSSEETEGVPGLGVVDTTVRRFRAGVRIPHFGWNEVVPTPGCRGLSRGYAYFANSYHLAELPDGWEGAHTDHGGPVVSAVQRGPVLACQFHPELSGRYGHALLTTWLESAPC